MPSILASWAAAPRQPAIGTLADRRGAFMREAHRIAREARDLFESYRAAFAYGMRAAWAQVKVARDTGVADKAESLTG